MFFSGLHLAGIGQIILGNILYGLHLLGNMLVYMVEIFSGLHLLGNICWVNPVIFQVLAQVAQTRFLMTV